MIAQRPVKPPKTVTAALRRAMDARDGHRCAWPDYWHAGCAAETLVPHHRVNRGMGGRPSLNRLSNLVWLFLFDDGEVKGRAA